VVTTKTVNNTGQDFYGEIYVHAANVIKKIYVKQTTSSDVTLRSLSVSSGTLSPSFSPDVIYYSVSVAHGVSSINISAKANSSHAVVKGTGYYPLDAGSNYCYITVSVGSNKQTYTVKVTRAAAPAPPKIVTASLPDGKVDKDYRATIEITGSTPIYAEIDTECEDWPEGLFFSRSSFTITGKPRKAGTYRFTVRATNSVNPYNPVTKQLSIKITDDNSPMLKWIDDGDCPTLAYDDGETRSLVFQVRSINYEVKSGASWLKVKKESATSFSDKYSGSATTSTATVIVNYRAEPNSSSQERSGMIIISDKSGNVSPLQMVVTQEARQTESFSATVENPVNMTSAFSVKVPVTARNVSWTVSVKNDPDGWFTVSQSNTRGSRQKIGPVTGSDPFYIHVPGKNSVNSERSAQIEITATGMGSGNVIVKYTTTAYQNPSSVDNEVILSGGELLYYPNPVDNVLTVQIPGAGGERAAITLTNLRGLVVYRAETLEKTLYVNMQPFAAGIYILRVKAGKGMYTGKVIRK
jgi:hypothetical protein